MSKSSHILALKRKVRPIIQLVEEAGATCEPKLSGGGHIKLTIRKGKRSRSYFMACTESDNRAMKNAVAFVRRLLSELDQDEIFA